MTHCQPPRHAVVITAVLALALGATTPARPKSIQYTASADARRAVLFLAVMSPQTAINRSMTLYGDGRLVLAELGAERQVLREKEFRLSDEESRELLELALDHNLAEYDETDVRARQLRGKVTPGAEGVIDAATTILRIALDSYSCDGRIVEDLEKEIHVSGVKSAAQRFPDILEFQGLKALQGRLYHYWDAAGWPLW